VAVHCCVRGGHLSGCAAADRMMVVSLPVLELATWAAIVVWVFVVLLICRLAWRLG